MSVEGAGNVSPLLVADALLRAAFLRWDCNPSEDFGFGTRLFKPPALVAGLHDVTVVR